jgi:hypothetical protein
MSEGVKDVQKEGIGSRDDGGECSRKVVVVGQTSFCDVASGVSLGDVFWTRKDDKGGIKNSAINTTGWINLG